MSTPPEASTTARSAVPLRSWGNLPGPRGLPWLGNALQIDRPRFHLQLEEWSREHGPFFKLQLMQQKILVVGEHEVVAAMLRDRPEGFRRTARLEDIWCELGLVPGVFGANGDTWRRQRRMVMAGFDPAHVKRYFPALVQVAQRLGQRWQQAARRGASIDLQADLMRYTVDTIAGLAFGAEVNTLASDGDVIQQHLDKLFPAIFKRLLSPLPTWRYFKTATDRQLERSVAEVQLAVGGFIAQARARMQAEPHLREHPHNLLEAMIAAADQPGSGIDDGQVAGNVLTLLLAGEDTTANTLAWLVHLLWCHPPALARATLEVRQMLAGLPAGAGLALEHMAELAYVEACIQETMRLRPVAPILPLQALHDTTLGDVQVAAGQVVIGLLRRDSVSDSHVPRAAAFEPERWLAGPGAMDAAARRTSMPFGAGPRICPGRYLALLEMKMAVVTLLGNFEIQQVSTVDGRPARELLAFTMMPVGLRMRLCEWHR